MNDMEEKLAEPMAGVTHGNGTEKLNPWREPISMITWGFLMTSCTMNFLLLQYILPTIGAALLYLGFRDMRKGNRWFEAAWVLSGIRLVWQVLQLIIYATPIIALDKNNMALGTMMVILQLFLLGVFRTATRTMLYEAGIKPDRDPALWLIVWMIQMGICAFTPLGHSWIIVFTFIGLYLAIISSFYNVGDDMGAVADAFIKAPVKVDSRVGAWGYLITCFVLVALCSIFANHITPVASEQAAITDSETRSKLLKLGFPKDIITDIPDKDIALLSDAFHVENISEVLNYRQTDHSSRERSNVNHSPLSKNEMKATTVYVELPDNLLYVFVYFMLKEGNAYWQDGFTIMGEGDFELLDGALLFHNDDTDYTSPISRLRCEKVANNNFFGMDMSRQISGVVSYPFKTENQRGYIFYRLQLPSKQWAGWNCFNYMHNFNSFHFPYEQTENKIQSNFLIDNIMQQNTNYEFMAYRDANGS